MIAADAQTFVLHWGVAVAPPVVHRSRLYISDDINKSVPTELLQPIS